MTVNLPAFLIVLGTLVVAGYVVIGLLIRVIFRHRLIKTTKQTRSTSPGPSTADYKITSRNPVKIVWLSYQYTQRGPTPLRIAFSSSLVRSCLEVSARGERMVSTVKPPFFRSTFEIYGTIRSPDFASFLKQRYGKPTPVFKHDA
jgi:hypothetical protein